MSSNYSINAYLISCYLKPFAEHGFSRDMLQAAGAEFCVPPDACVSVLGSVYVVGVAGNASKNFRHRPGVVRAGWG